MSFQIGDIVGDYKITGEVGSGGMGRVFKVEHNITRRAEAMKVLLRDQENQPELARRFLREIQLQASLNHPNIAAVHNAFSFGEDLVMVMELVEGASLERLLEPGRIPWQTGIDYACQALSALSYAHARDVTHRDIKPANMIVTPEGALKLTDFGLAKMLTDTSGLTRSGAPMGSVFYMSPEQVQGASTVDARTDIYSLGAALYELATGQKPFHSGSAFEVMRAHVEQAPAPPLDKDPSLPAALNDAILTALAKKPEERFQTAEEFLAALERTKQSGTLPAAPWRSRSLQLGFGIAALVLAALFFGGRPHTTTTTTVDLPAVRDQKSLIASRPAERTVAKKPDPEVVTLPKGTILKVRTTALLSTDTHQAGAIFTATLQEPLAAGDWVVAPKGASVEGRITEAVKGGRLKGRPWLAVCLTRVPIGNGRTLRIATNSIGAPGGGARIFLLKRGGPAVLSSGTSLTFHLVQPVRVPRPQTGG